MVLSPTVEALVVQVATSPNQAEQFQHPESEPTLLLAQAVPMSLVFP